MSWLTLPFYTWVKYQQEYTVKLHNTVVDVHRRVCKTTPLVSVIQLYTDTKEAIGYEITFSGNPQLLVTDTLLFATYRTPANMKLDVLFTDAALRVLDCGGAEILCVIRKKADNASPC